MRVLVEGVCRAPRDEVPWPATTHMAASCRRSTTTPGRARDRGADAQRARAFNDYVHLNRRIPDEVLTTANNITDPVRSRTRWPRTCWSRCRGSSSCSRPDGVGERLKLLGETLASELEILKLERKIEGQVRSQVHKNQKEFYLNEQLKAIRKELGHQNEFASEIEELGSRSSAGAHAARGARRRR